MESLRTQCLMRLRRKASNRQDQEEGGSHLTRQKIKRLKKEKRKVLEVENLKCNNR
jgi:hypothetical protein